MKSSDTVRLPMFQVVNYEEATPEVKAIYDDTMKSLSLPFVLNWFKCQGNNATLLKGNWGKLKNTLLEGDVPNILKQLIIYNVSLQKGCNYCAHAHGIFANLMGKSIKNEPGFKITEHMDEDYLPSSYKRAIKVVTKAALASNTISNDDFASLFEVGFSEMEIQELMAQADLVNMLNTIADVSGVKIDNELLEIEV